MEEYALEEERRKSNPPVFQAEEVVVQRPPQDDSRSKFRKFLDNFSGQAEFQAQKQGEQLQAEIDYFNSPEGQRAAQIGGGIMAGLLPIPGSKLLGAGRVAKPIIDKMYGAVGKDMVNQGIRNVGSKLPGSSGARVGSDAMGRAPLPVSKAPVQTARGPRGPINVEQPMQSPLRLGGGARNTGGVSETDKAMIDWMLPKGTGKYRAKEVDKVKWNKDQLPRKSDRILQRRPANAEEVEIIKDLTKKGFYDKSGSKGIMNTPPARSQMEKVGAAKQLEQQTNRRSFLQAERSRLNSMRSQGEATQDDMNKLFKIQEELEAINKLLK
jgi:hypothetical protein